MDINANNVSVSKVENIASAKKNRIISKLHTECCPLLHRISCGSMKAINYLECCLSVNCIFRRLIVCGINCAKFSMHFICYFRTNHL
jgi:hypothetical protein